jgi:hypothetical protein
MGQATRKLVRPICFALWLAAATFAATTLTAWHAVALPTRATPAQHLPTHTWHLTHYLSADCNCSLEIARYLTNRALLPPATEEIMLVDGIDTRAEQKLIDSLDRAHFPYTTISAEALASRDGVEAVPLLTIEAPDGTVRFRGGYHERGTPAGEYLDITILADLMASRPAPNPRVYGCATSRRLRSQLDPLSLLSLLHP